MEGRINIHAIRLKPGDDLKKVIQDFVASQHIKAGWVISCAGSLTQHCLRFANRQKASMQQGFYEIISLSGTLSVNGSHLHIGIADGDGHMTGGHLLEGCIVYTTAEIVIGESPALTFQRVLDDATGWKELQINDRSNENT